MVDLAPLPAQVTNIPTEIPTEITHSRPSITPIAPIPPIPPITPITRAFNRSHLTLLLQPIPERIHPFLTPLLLFFSCVFPPIIPPNYQRPEDKRGVGSGGLQLEDLTSDQRMAIEMAKTGDSIFFTVGQGSRVKGRGSRVKGQGSGKRSRVRSPGVRGPGVRGSRGQGVKGSRGGHCLGQIHPRALPRPPAAAQTRTRSTSPPPPLITPPLVIPPPPPGLGRHG